MKKLLTSIAIVLIVSTSINAQMFTKKIKGDGDIITKTRTISDYDKIGVAGAFDVKLIKGNEGKITIEADKNLMEYIITEVRSGNLKIKTKKGYHIQSRKTIKIIVPFENIDAVSLAGSGDVYSSDMIDATNLKLSLAGSGNFDLTVSTKNLTSSIAGSGNIHLKGNSTKFSCSIAGSGDINAFSLKTSITTIKIAGSGNVKVNATDEIYAKSTGSGNIYYSGNPTIEKISQVGSGSIKKKD